jgi:hypothetical protein
MDKDRESCMKLKNRCIEIPLLDIGFSTILAKQHQEKVI